MSWNDLRKGRFSAPSGEYFITFTANQRAPLFSDFGNAKCVCRCIHVNESRTNCQWLAWVLMPDHFHGLVRLRGDSNLSEVIKDLKGRSSHSLKRNQGIEGKCWQPAFYDRALRKEEERVSIARYIVANPLRANIVRSIRSYPYWNTVYL